MTTSSAATWSGAGAGAGWGSGTTGLPDPLLATPGARLHTLSLILAGDAYIWFILYVGRMQDLPTGRLQLRTLPDGLQQITVSFY